MRRTSLPPARLMYVATFLPEDFPRRLEWFKEFIGLTWDGLAGCLGVDPRQLQRWRDGTKPSGDGLCALIKLGSSIPGGLYILLDVYEAPPPPAGMLQPPLAAAFGLDDRRG